MRKFLFITVLVLIAVSVYYFSFEGKSKLANIFDGAKPDSFDDFENAETVSGNSAILEPDPIFAEPVKYSSLNTVYSSNYFSIKYPDGFKVFQTQISSAQEVFTVENVKGSGFQIFVISWDEAGPITPERIWQDELDAEINDPKNADLDGSKALVFYGYNGDLGETFEVWTARKGKLYQITGPKTAEDLIISTLETWDWK
jgi:hypothetical protein